MDKTVQLAAAHLLDYIAQPESRGNYDCISSNKQGKLKTPITKMTLRDLLTAMQTWRKTLGSLSSAAGRYQIIYKTLVTLVQELKLDVNQKFTPDLQDRLGFHLLRKRGYDAFVFGRIGVEEYGKRLAQEWASLPVLAGTKNYKNQNITRGTSYYAGDGLNNHGVSASEFEAALKNVLVLHDEAPAAPQVKKSRAAQFITLGAAAGTVGTGAVVSVDAAVEKANDTVTQFGPMLDAVTNLSKYGPTIAAVGVGTIFTAVIVVWLYNKWQSKE